MTTATIDLSHHESVVERAQSLDLSTHAHWLIRVPFAAVFLFHGIGKVADMAAFAGMMHLPFLVAWLVALAEVGAGLGILIGGAFRTGLVTRLAGLAIVPVMLGAIALVHWGQWSFVASDSHPMGGMEFQVLLLGIGLWFALVGNASDRGAR